jgi:hypothetical protein
VAGDVVDAVLRLAKLSDVAPLEMAKMIRANLRRILGD